MKLFLMICFVLFPMSSFALVSATYDCKKGATAFITHPNKAGDELVINGVGSKITTDIAVAFACYSTMVVGCQDNDYRVVIVPSPSAVHQSELVSYIQMSSLVVGLCAAMAFVIASRGDS